MFVKIEYSSIAHRSISHNYKHLCIGPSLYSYILQVAWVQCAVLLIWLLGHPATTFFTQE